MKVFLDVSENTNGVKRIFLESDAMIGRSTSCNLRVLSRHVSRRHAHLAIGEEAATLRDLGSSNGTFLNGVRLEAEKAYDLSTGDDFSIGPVQFVFHMEVDGSRPDLKVMPAAIEVDSSVARESGEGNGRPVDGNGRAASPVVSSDDQSSHESDDSEFAGERPAGVELAENESPDDLTRISGVGPKIAETLNELGIHRFSQVAEFTEANVEWVDSYLSFKGRIDREDWIGQAQNLAAEGGADDSDETSEDDILDFLNDLND